MHIRSDWDYLVLVNINKNWIHTLLHCELLFGPTYVIIEFFENLLF
jgi:hypothetical protein